MSDSHGSSDFLGIVSSPLISGMHDGDATGISTIIDEERRTEWED